MRRAFKVIGGWSAGIAMVLGLSYCSELPKYRFERVAAEAGHGMPGARLIGSFKTADLVSPASWLWPATTTWNFAAPDPLILSRFFTITLIYDEKESPIVFLVDVDCEAPRKQILYDLNQPDNALPARDASGQPVVDPNGKTYRRLPESANVAPPSEWLRVFCDTDWTAERHSISQHRR